MSSWNSQLKMEIKASQIVCLDALQRWWRERTRTTGQSKKTPLDLTTPWQKHEQGEPATQMFLGSTAMQAAGSAITLLESPLFAPLHTWWARYSAAANMLSVPIRPSDALQLYKSPWKRKPRGPSMIKASVSADASNISNSHSQQSKGSGAIVIRAATMSTYGTLKPGTSASSSQGVDIQPPWRDAPWRRQPEAPWQQQKAKPSPCVPPPPPPKPVQLKRAGPPLPPPPVRKVARFGT